MRKWTYLVAALLMGGVSTSLTSCIDNDEPAGITDLRGAKAELLRAKAAVQQALAAKEQAWAEGIIIGNQGKEINNQIKQLELELKQAATEWKKDSLQAMRDTLAVSLQTSLIKLQQKQAQADFNLKKTMEDLAAQLITMKDDIYSAKLGKYMAQLVGGRYYDEEGSPVTLSPESSINKDYTDAQSALFKLEIQRIQFLSQDENYASGLEIEKAEYEETKKILEGLLADLEAIDPTDDAALNAKLAEKNNALAALDKEEAEKIAEIEKTREEILGKAGTQEILKAEETLAKPGTYTIATSDVSSEMVDDLYAITKTFKGNKAFDDENNDGIDVKMTTDWVMSGQGYDDMNGENKGAQLSSLATAILSKYTAKYQSAYDEMFHQSIYDITNEDGTIKEEYTSKVANEIERLKIDGEQLKATAEKDLKAWIDAYKAYMDALETYKNYKGVEYYRSVIAEIKKYNGLDTKTVAAANTLRTLLIDYFNKREAVDGVDGGTFRTDYKDAFAADADLTTFNSLVGYYESNPDYNLGEEHISTNRSGNDKCKLDAFLDATSTVFGGYQYSLNEAVQPTVTEKADKTKEYTMPAGYEPTGGTYKAYLDNQDAQNTFGSIDQWVALYQKVNKDAVDAQLIADNAISIINAGRTEQLEALEALWKMEIETFLIKGQASEEIRSIFSTDEICKNPYIDIYVNSNYSLTTKYSVLEKEISDIQNLINTGNIFYVDYTQDGGYEVVPGTLESAIDNIENKIEQIEADIIEVQTKIDLYAEYKFKYETEGTVASQDNCLKMLDDAIAAKQKEVDYKKAAVTRLENTIKKLLEAYNGDSTTEVPETPEEGGEETPAE